MSVGAELVSRSLPIQGTFDELGTPLREVTFVVVDLETTGGSPADCRITEIGAVKVCGGESCGEFQTLVNPGLAIPAFIAVLTGITDALVAEAPPIGAVLSSFLEFAKGSVLVAHNAPFDVGFLKAACVETGQDWPDFQVLDTARLARRTLTRDDAPDCRLASLARLFRSTTTPNHRALFDARATVDVLHGLLERLGNHGIHSLEELATFSSRVSLAQRRKRYLADCLPAAPGVYVFKDAQGQALYVGKSRNIRTRVRNYFTASEMRSRMAEMVGLAESVTPIVCSTALEAEVRELRLIGELKPRYNRRSRFPEKVLWLKLTTEPFPRLSVVRHLRDDGADYLGPFSTRRAAEQAMAALHETIPLRQCNLRLTPRRPVSACVLAEIGRCHAPCDGSESIEEYAEHAAAARRAFRSDARPVVEALSRRIDNLAGSERFEDAATARDRLGTFLRAAARMQRLSALAACRELIAAQRTPELGWELIVVRSGRLTAATEVPRGTDPRPVVAAMRETAEVVSSGPGPTPAASAEESECILRWLDRPGTRLVELDGVWASPSYGAGGRRELMLPGSMIDRTFDTRPDRALRPSHQPAAFA